MANIWTISNFLLGSSTGTASTSTIPFSHNNNSSSNNNSNNNNMTSSNLNLTATHNGFGLNHHSINQTHSNHFNSTSVLTYRSNRRSMDRSDNKISDTVTPSLSSSSSTRNALPCNDPIQEGNTPSRSYLNMCLHIIYKTLMFIYCGFSKRRSSTLNNSNHKLPDSAFSRFMSMLKYRVVGGSGDTGNYTRSISNDSGNEQSSYIERIDDEHMDNSDLSVDTTAGKVSTSFPSNAPITIELPPTRMFSLAQCPKYSDSKLTFV